MIDTYQKAIEKLKVESEENYEGDIFEQTKVNISTVEGLYRTAIKVHDHTLVIFFIISNNKEGKNEKNDDIFWQSAFLMSL